jgi:hypothetical protein
MVSLALALFGAQFISALAMLMIGIAFGRQLTPASSEVRKLKPTRLSRSFWTLRMLALGVAFIVAFIISLLAIVEFYSLAPVTSAD